MELIKFFINDDFFFEKTISYITYEMKKPKILGTFKAENVNNVIRRETVEYISTKLLDIANARKKSFDHANKKLTGNIDHKYSAINQLVNKVMTIQKEKDLVVYCNYLLNNVFDYLLVIKPHKDSPYYQNFCIFFRLLLNYINSVLEPYYNADLKPSDCFTIEVASKYKNLVL